MFRSLLVILLLVPAAPVFSNGFDGLSDGESFTYRISWGIFSNAGRLRIGAERVIASEEGNILRVKVETSSRGLVRTLYRLDDRSEGLIDVDTGRILSIRESGYDGRRTVETETVFDYEERQAVFVDQTRPDRSRVVKLPPDEDPIDLISGLIQTRRWKMQPGDEREILVYASRSIYPLVIRAEAYEDLRTSAGRIRTLRLVPTMRGEPRGLFARGAEVKVWITQGGAEELPVQMQLQLSVGSAMLQLVEHQPGDGG